MVVSHYNSLMQRLVDDTIELRTHPIKIALLNSSGIYSAGHTTFANVAGFEVSGTGYTSGGLPLNNKVFSLAGSTAKMSADNVILVGASLSFRYGVMYADAVNNGVTKPLIAHIDFEETITLNNANYTLSPDSTLGWLYFAKKV